MSTLTAEAFFAIEGLMFHAADADADPVARRNAYACLAELDAVGAYDRDLLLARARRDRGERAALLLAPVLSDFEAGARV